MNPLNTWLALALATIVVVIVAMAREAWRGFKDL